MSRQVFGPVIVVTWRKRNFCCGYCLHEPKILKWEMVREGTMDCNVLYAH